MKPELSSFLDHLAERTGKGTDSSPVHVPGAKQFFLGGDVLDTFFPSYDDEAPSLTPAKVAAYEKEVDEFLLKLYAAVTAIKSSGGRGRSYLLWIKWGHDDEGNFPPLDPATAKEDTFPLPSQPYKLNQSWELIQYKFRTEIAPRGGGSGGAGNVVFWFAPPTPTLRYAFDGPQAGSDESYGYTS